MNCKNCGAPITQNMNWCEQCGEKIDKSGQQNQNNRQQQGQNYKNQSQNNRGQNAGGNGSQQTQYDNSRTIYDNTRYEDATIYGQTYSDNNATVYRNNDYQLSEEDASRVYDWEKRSGYYDDYASTKKKSSKGLYIALAVTLVLVIALAVLLFIVFNQDSDKNSGGESGKKSGQTEVKDDTKSETGVTLTVDDYESETEDDSVKLTGTIRTEAGSAKLTINGTVVDAITYDEGTKEWSKKVSLEDGSNTFKIRLEDNSGEVDIETVEIEKLSSLMYPKGTVLVKSNWDAVYVRPTPKISKEYIILIPKNDYSSEFVCVGEEHIDEDGYVWCKVRTPHNGIGWIRSDLMKVYE